MNEYATEGVGLKVLLSGGAGAGTGWLAGIDLLALISVGILLCGLALQVVGSSRRKREMSERRAREKEKHALEMQILRQKIAELRITVDEVPDGPVR